MKLKPKDKIALVCTGSPCESEQAVQDVKAFLEAAFRCEVVYSNECYQSLSPKERSANFLSFALDPKVKAIWALRGGEGSADLLPYISRQLMSLVKLDRKFLIGFSDFTPFLTYFYEQLNWRTIHAIGAQQLTKRLHNVQLDDASFDMLRALLLKGESPHFSTLTPLNDAAKKSAQIKSLITGGNISLLSISIKDIWHVNTKNKIVLLEEVNEPPYRLARTIKYLSRVGFFNEAKAVIFAGIYFEPHQTKIYNEYNEGIGPFLSAFAKEQTIPVLYTPQISHGSVNYPLPFYLPAKLSLGEAPTLVF